MSTTSRDRKEYKFKVGSATSRDRKEYKFKVGKQLAEIAKNTSSR